MQHPSLWTLVQDSPKCQTATISRHRTQDEAERTAASLEHHNLKKYGVCCCAILPPATQD